MGAGLGNGVEVPAVGRGLVASRLQALERGIARETTPVMTAASTPAQVELDQSPAPAHPAPAVHDSPAGGAIDESPLEDGELRF